MGETSKGWEGSDPGLRDLAELLEPDSGFFVKVNQIRHELEELLVLSVGARIGGRSSGLLRLGVGR